MENTGKVPYHHMVEELKEKLRISEESRRLLQQKFDAMMQTYKVKEHARYNALRKNYGAFLEEDQRRQERNENLLQMLERIDNRSASLAARTERLALLRKHYEQYLGHIYPSWKMSSHRLSTGPHPVKIRDHYEDVSGYGTHTGSSGYVRESERFEEPRISAMSTSRASTHLYKTDNVLPDKYRIPRAEFDTPSISVSKPKEKQGSILEMQPPKLDLGKFEINKIPDVVSRSMAVSPRDRTPREQFNQPEFEIDQNTSGDLLNMSLSDDGVPSISRSETDAVTRHQHWETLRQAYINRQQPLCNERISVNESSQDNIGWSPQRENPPHADYRSVETDRQLQHEQPTEQVRIEKESFRDKIRRLKVMIQENKELEQSIDEPVNGNTDQQERMWDHNSNNKTDNAFQQQRVRRQSVVDGQGLVDASGSEGHYSRQEDRNLNNNEIDATFQQQRGRRQSVVNEQGLVNTQNREKAQSRMEDRNSINNGKTVQHQESVHGERRIVEGTLRRRMSVGPPDQIRPDNMYNDYQRTEQNWMQGSEGRRSSIVGERGHYMPEQQIQQLEALRENERPVQSEPKLEQQPELSKQEERVEKPVSEERHLYKEEMSSGIDSAQNAQYMEQNANFGFTAEQYTTEQGRPPDHNRTQQGDFVANENKENHTESRSSKDTNKEFSAQDNNQYPKGESQDIRSSDLKKSPQPDNAPSEQYYEDNPAYGDNRDQHQEQGFYRNTNQNYDGGYNYNQEDAQYDHQYQTHQPDGSYYPQEQEDNANQEQKSYPQPSEQEYYQDKTYYGQQEPEQYANQYDPQQQQYDSQQQQQYDPQQQQYNSQQQQQYDPQQQQYDSQQQQQYHSQQQQQCHSQQQQQYDQQYDGQQQEYDPQQQQYDSQQQQQYAPEQQYDSQQQQQYGAQQQQQPYESDSYGWQQSSDQQEQLGETREQYQYYSQPNQDYGYDQSQRGTQYGYPQQNPNESYSKAGENDQGETVPIGREDGQGTQPREETANKYFPDISDESTQESERSRDVPMGRSHESPSQRSIDRYRTMLGIDPNSDPAYSEVDEIEDEMAAVVASGTSTRMQAADNVTPTTASNSGQKQSTPLETNPKQIHDDSSDFDYSSGQ